MFIILIIIVCIWMLSMLKETFQASNIDKDELQDIQGIQSLKVFYERETSDIRKVLYERVITGSYPRDYKTFYTMDFLFEKLPVVENIKRKIQMVMDEKMKDTVLDNVKVINSLYNVYTKVDFYRNSMNIIFNVDLTSVRLGFTRKFLVYIKLNNVNAYIDERGNFYPILNSIYDDLEIVYMEPVELSKEMDVEYNRGSLDENVYQIRNRMSYIKKEFSDMNITDNDKVEFDKRLNDKGRVFGDAKCFGGVGETREECIKNMGIWDERANRNEDCPYYKANDNYPNTFGGIIDKEGLCELPINMKNVGYTGYSKIKDDIPLCYNCKYNNIGNGTLGYCCEDQLTNKDVYKNLMGPDYAFAGDKQERRKWSSFFLENNLSVE